MKRFTKEHEWIEIKDDLAVVGITEHAAGELGDITFVELPELTAHIEQGDPIGVVESVKAAADIYSPITGDVAEVNSELEDAPEVINESPEGDGWICKLSGFNADDLEALMTDEEYAEFTAS